MSDPDRPSPPEAQSLTNRFVTITLGLEGLLAVVGVAGGSLSGVGWARLLSLEPTPWAIGVGAGVGLALLNGFLLLAGGEANPLYRWIFRPFRRALLQRLPPLSWEDIVLISVMSGLAEEILFRGWLQTTLGWIPASLLFGAVHVWGREGVGYGLYATVLGAALGGLMTVTGSLWAPVLAHGVNNFLGLAAVKTGWLPPDPELSGRSGRGSDSEGRSEEDSS